MAKYHPRETLEEKAVLKLLQKEHDVHGFDDMPSGILAGFVSLWAFLLLLFWAFFTGDIESRFAVTVASLFIGMFFAVPLLMAWQAKPKLPRPFETVTICTGQIGASAAAIQVVLIPAALTLAIGIMGLIKISVLTN